MILGLWMALVLVLAGLWLTRPLWRRAAPRTQARKRANVVAYQTRVAEIEADLAAAVLDVESARQLRDEAGARLLHDADTVAAVDAAAAAPPRHLRWTLAVIVLLALASGLFYWRSDSWRTRDLIALAQSDPAAAQRQMIDGMVAKLETHLHAEPADAEGWAMLGRSYVVLQRFADAAKAYARANALTVEQPHADWLVAAGASLGMASDGHDLKPGRALFEQALTLEPGNAEALWYGGLAALQSGDYGAAYAEWLKLRGQDLPDDIREVLEQHLPELAAKAGQTLPPATALAAAAPAAAANGVSLIVHVRISDALKAQIKPGMTLLVFAKAATGPPMPLAVQRIDTPTLPLTVTLDDSEAMMPAMKMSGFANWVITARLTASGGAQALSGDLEGSHPVARADAGQPLDLVIDRQLP
ncbi:c-type cytochrome biogenesis protein CcmI [Solimonas terrae]|uniref:C-type cytochrome biogenesis protein CcmI n=1 Tax=Solimonas terrae TaxID=1396819 RepID=A0A6M2BS19_9GAMM|nr:c-type cytochrome biogenesis protein CcmI [Solimonas terrae]NGY05422.1 c-type cytochrome biogenesis protein CcmI [Solimonas terrae]